MPIRRAAPTPTEVLLAREACEPLLATITHRLLRGGFARYVEFRLAYARECERAVASSQPASGSPSGRRAAPPQATRSSAFGMSGSSSFAASVSAPPPPVREPPRRRINPEGLKAVFAQSGLLLTPENYTSILLGYSDAVGFVLADDLLAALHPCQQAPASLARAVSDAVAASFFSGLPGACAVLTLDSAREVLAALFTSDAADASVAAAQEVTQADVQATFTSAVYGGAAVPCDDLVTFIVLTLQQHPCLTPTMPSRYAAVSAAGLELTPASSGAAQRSAELNAAASASGIDGTALFSIRHTGSTTQRRFERYEVEKDRRDEWIHGRDEADARAMYMRHAAGYAGHLPEYQYHFGRTFHVIEENLPQLTKPAAPLEPVPADWYGPGVVLQDSRMNAHHYRFA